MSADYILRLFNMFYEEYPRKVARQDALKAFSSIVSKEKDPFGFTNRICNAVRSQRGCWDWKKDNGKFIPYPATWLRAGRWDDIIDSPDSKSEVEAKRLTSIAEELINKCKGDSE